MMKVVGEEGTSLEDYVVYLKGELLDAVYLQQNSFDPVDQSVSPQRQKKMFALVLEILGSTLEFKDKEDARSWFYELRQAFLDLNGAEETSGLHASSLEKIRQALASRHPVLENLGREALASLE
jgi:V/A-type H+-transporting ATPase subunit A